MSKCAIIGGGFVGRATSLLCGPNSIIYDLRPDLCRPHGCSWDDVLRCDMVFVCVPTPMDSATGECHLGAVSSVLDRFHGFHGDIILRSTVPVGTSDKLGVHFLPEFLTEKNWERDVRSCSQWIIGTDDPSLADRFTRVLTRSVAQGIIASDRTCRIRPSEAEAVKLFRNNFLAVKVAFCNEWSSFCLAAGIDYDTVRHHAALDPRIGSSHTHVPGHDGRPGFGGTCLPKDIASSIHQFQAMNVPCPVLTSARMRNDEMDRSDKDWASDVGRSVIEKK